jgi:hypothetical protein
MMNTRYLARASGFQYKFAGKYCLSSFVKQGVGEVMFAFAYYEQLLLA